VSKKRLYEIAKEVGVESKVVVAKAQELGLSVKSHSSSVEEADANRITSSLKGGAVKAESKPASKVAPAPKEEKVAPKVVEAPASKSTPAKESPKAEAKETPATPKKPQSRNFKAEREARAKAEAERRRMEEEERKRREEEEEKRKHDEEEKRKNSFWGKFTLKMKEISGKILEAEKIDKKLCVFEYIYFARGDSHIDGQSVYQSRLNMGRELYNETKYDADIVMSIPDSGTTAALGYARASGIPFAEGLVKNRYSGRTFIKPNQEERELAVRMKLNALPHIVGGKRIVLIDDSIVRGTTSGIIVKMLKEAGAKEVYMCVSSPTIEYSCHYGIDTSVRKELIAATHTVDEIKDYIHADKLHYLSRDGLCRAVSDIAPNDLCFACFNGDYSVEVPAEQEEGVKYVLE